MPNAAPVTAATGGQTTPVILVTSGQATLLTDVLALGTPIAIVGSGPAMPVQYAGAASAFFSAVAAAGGTISAGRQTLYTNMFNSLVSVGLLTKLERLGILAAENAATAKVDLVNPSLQITLVNAPVFTVDQGYASVSGTISYINTGAIPGSLTKFTQNDAMFGVGTLSTRAVGQDLVIIGTKNMSGGSNLYLWNSADGAIYNANGASIFGGSGAHPAANVKGLWASNRTGAGAQALFRNGTSVLTNTNASGVPAEAQPFLLGAWRNADNSIFSYDTGIVSAYFIGQSLTAPEMTSLATIINTYMTAIGSPLF